MLSTLIAALVLGTPSPDVPSPIGPEPCVFVIPTATPGHWICGQRGQPAGGDTMKRLIIGGLAALAVGGPLAGAGTAQATPQDFFNSLENGYNVNVWDYPMMLGEGYTACQLLWDDVNPSWWLRGVGYDS